MIRKQEVLNDVVIKFAGDSGDGMQLTGSQFTNNTALLGIDLATFPIFLQKYEHHKEPCPVLVDTNYDFQVTLFLLLAICAMYL
jgi:hypothetical protein